MMLIGSPPNPHRRAQVRAQILRVLATLTEQYPNLRVGQTIANAIPGRDLFNLSDVELAAALIQLQATYGQFTAAGMKT